MNEADYEQQMRFVDTDKYIKDGVEYIVTYEPSGVVTLEARDGA